MVAGDHGDPDAGAPAGGDGAGRASGRGGSSSATRPSSSRSRSASSATRASTGPRRSRVATASTRSPRPASACRRLGRRRQAPCSDEHRVGRAFHDEAVADDHRHPPPARVEREAAPAVGRRSCDVVGTSTPTRRARASSAASIGSPRATASARRRSCDAARRATQATARASAAAAQVPSRRRRRAPRPPGRSRRRSRSRARPAGDPDLDDVISFRVRVPVLSVQMNVVEPKRLHRLQAPDQGVAAGHASARRSPATA